MRSLFTHAVMRADAAPSAGSIPGGETLTVGALGGGVVWLAWRFLARLVREDEARQAAMRDEIRANHRRTAELLEHIKAIEVKLAVCETQRDALVHDVEAIKTLLEAEGKKLP